LDLPRGREKYWAPKAKGLELLRGHGLYESETWINLNRSLAFGSR
jgi:hypothetical protein